jgi:hypothetical protein
VDDEARRLGRLTARAVEARQAASRGGAAGVGKEGRLVEAHRVLVVARALRGAAGAGQELGAIALRGRARGEPLERGDGRLVVLALLVEAHQRAQARRRPAARAASASWQKSMARPRSESAPS